MLTRCWVYEGGGEPPLVVHDHALVEALEGAVNYEDCALIEAREGWDYVPDGAEAPAGGTCQVIERLDLPPLVLHDDALVRALMRALNSENLAIIEPRRAVDYRPCRAPARSAWTGAQDDGR